MKLQVLPLAITMMAGPQIMSDIIFLTAKKPIQTTLPFVVGVALAVTTGTAICLAVASSLHIDLGDSSDSSSKGTTIQLVFVGFLIAYALYNLIKRDEIKPPGWIGALQQAGPKKAFATGFLLVLLFPTDILSMMTVAINLEQNGSSFVEALPFIGATILIAALPLLFYLLFRKKAQETMPKVRDWMNNSAWMLNIIVCGIFIFLILG